MGYSNRKPYYDLDKSQLDFFGGSSRFLKTSLDKESQFEKPYLESEYPIMHLRLPNPTWPSRLPRRPVGAFGEIRRNPLMLYIFPPPSCGIISVEGRRGGVSSIGSGFGGTTGYGFGLDCGDVSILEFNADSFFFAEWSWKFSLSSGDLNVGDISSVISRNTISVSTEVPGTTGTLMVCALGFAGQIPLVWTRPWEVGTTMSLFGPFTYIPLASQKGLVHCCEEILFNCSEIVCDCTDISIGYTTQQMAVNEVQTLTVVNPVGGCTYNWAIDSGGGSLSVITGTSTDYTATSSNAECANNPTISLSVEGNTCDTLEIAINAYTSDIEAFWEVFHETGGECIYLIKRYSMKCDGTVYYQNLVCDSCSCPTVGTCAACCCDFVYDPPGCNGNWECNEEGFFCFASELLSRCTGSDGCQGMSCVEGTVLDKRSGALITAGCCPAALL